jgi:uncharacterized glyoxalase superfamily protein PhnB
MQVKRVSCGIITPRILDCREFYCQLFGFQVVSDNAWYIQLRSADNHNEIGLLSPSQITQPRILQRVYQGDGCWINIEVEDIDAAYQQVLEFSVSIELELRDEPWGERHFIVRDPAGMAVNVMAKQNKDSAGYLP